MMQCPVCSGDMPFLFTAAVLGRYRVSYFKCTRCGFIQTEKPYWLKEAYSDAVSSLDVGLVQRNLRFSSVVERIINSHFDRKARFLDFAGGYGLLVRLMRDKGFDFYWQDLYCENIFAKYHDIRDLEPKGKFELITAFEVAEHMQNPLVEISMILDMGDALFLSTELQPSACISNVADWWYFVPESGQHLAFHTAESLRLIAEKMNCRIYSDGASLHLLSRRLLRSNPFRAEKQTFCQRLSSGVRQLTSFFRSEEKRESLLQSDFVLAKQKLKEMGKMTQ